MKSFVYMKHGWCNYVNMREIYKNGLKLIIWAV